MTPCATSMSASTRGQLVVGTARLCRSAGRIAGARRARRGLPAPAPRRRSWPRGPCGVVVAEVRRLGLGRDASVSGSASFTSGTAARAGAARSGVDAASLWISPRLKIYPLWRGPARLRGVPTPHVVRIWSDYI